MISILAGNCYQLDLRIYAKQMIQIDKFICHTQIIYWQNKVTGLKVYLLADVVSQKTAPGVSPVNTLTKAKVQSCNLGLYGFKSVPRGTCSPKEVFLAIKPRSTMSTAITKVVVIAIIQNTQTPITFLNLTLFILVPIPSIGKR